MAQVTLPRYQPMHGWANRLLRVDLSSGRIWAEETAPRVPAFLGARGLAASILWDEYPEPVDPFDERAPLMIIPGALTGTTSPYSGRTSVCGFSPQCWPYPWFTRSNIGADWGARLKRAGYDGLVVTGASERPVMLTIHDDEVQLLPADGTSGDGTSGDALWGLDTLETQQAVQNAYGADTGHPSAVRTLCIGPAGERLSRIATIQTGSTSVAGQSGFGAVMGAKKLKAIAVVGTGQVSVADPERLRPLFKAVGAELRTQRGRRRDLGALNGRLEDEGGGRARMSSCTAACPAPCRLLYQDVPGCHFDRKWTGAMNCVSGRFQGGGRNKIYDWDLGLRGGVELNMYANGLGLNHWDLLVGVIPWLRACNLHGLLDEVDGQAFDLNSIDFWVHLLDAIANRQGMGDALAEGGWRGAQQLDLGVELMRRYYTGWGYAGHWDGHGALVNPIVYPFWLVGALHWAMDTRDPASSTHGYVQGVMHWGPFREALFGRPSRGDRTEITWDHMRGIGERVYGRADTLDPLSSYEGKAVPAAYHAVRSVMKDCLPTDDQVFPLMWSYNTADRFCRIPIAEGPDEGTVIDGIDVDAALLRAGTGLDWDTAELQHAAERVLNLERAIVIRHWGRTRAMDERVLPYFAYDENWINPELGERQRLDVDRFKPVMDDYYRLRGWDVETGWPTRERLAHLDLGHVYDDMVAGAQGAQARLPDLPPERPVVDHHRP